MGHTPHTRLTAYRKTRARRTAWLKANGPCKNGSCSSWKDLEVHHRDPSKKVSHNVWSWSEERRVKELAKCDPWCHDCHTEHHIAPRRKHGLNCYMKRKCRCGVCRAAKAVERRGYRERKRLKVASTNFDCGAHNSVGSNGTSCWRHPAG